MARKHRELHLLLNDVEELRHYTQSATSKHNALEDAIGKARARFKDWEGKAKEGIERVAGAKREMDEAKEEA